MLITDLRVGALFIFLVVASVWDCRSNKIPNWLTGGGAAFGLIYNTAVPIFPHTGFVWALEGLLLGLLMLLPLYAAKVLGAGDVKLMAMAGAFLGIPDTFFAVLAVFIVGGAAALAFALRRKVMGRLLVNISDAVRTMASAAMSGTGPSLRIEASRSVGTLPYGVSIAVGTIGYVLAKQLGYV